MRYVRKRISNRELLAWVMAAALALSSCGSNEVNQQSQADQELDQRSEADREVDQQPEADRAGVVEIEYANGGSAPIEFDIIRIDWNDNSELESASFGDGVDLGISGTSPAQGSIEAVIVGGSKDWLRLSFDTGEAPEGLTVTIVTSSGTTLTHVYGSDE